MAEQIEAKKQGGHEWCGCCSCLAVILVIPAILIAIALGVALSFLNPNRDSAWAAYHSNYVHCPEETVSNFAKGQNIWLPSINQNLPYYQAAAEKIGVPWELLAAIHYREHSFSSASPDDDGPMQILSSTWNESIVPGIKRDFGITLTDRTDFQQALLGAAYKLKKGVGALTNQKGPEGNYLVSPHDIQRAMKFYNAGNDNAPETWSYVMNNFSPQHIAGRTLQWIKDSDSQDGAYAVYSFLVNAKKNPDGMIQSVGNCEVYEPKSNMPDAMSNPELEKEIMDLIADQGFDPRSVAVSAVGPNGGVEINSDTRFRSASAIKAGLLLAWLNENGVPPPGSEADKTLRKMIIASDNSSANQVIQWLGGHQQATAKLAGVGATSAAIRRDFGVATSPISLDKDNVMSANDGVAIMNTISQLPQDKNQYALNLLSQSERGYIRRGIEGTVFSKSGECPGGVCRNDIAMYGSGGETYYISVLINNSASNRSSKEAEYLITEISKKIGRSI